MTPRPLFLLAAAALAFTAPAAAQDNPNFIRPALEIEARLDTIPFEVLEARGVRSQAYATIRLTMVYPDSLRLRAKMKPAPPGGDTTFNNRPRYEVAAYELQKLFLSPTDFVVPPTVLRPLPLDLVRRWNPQVVPTFGGTQSAVVELQYWLSSVTPEGFWDPARFRQDTLYARFLANMNILAYLIRHSDDNVGNFLISTDPAAPHVYSVDNGIAFTSNVSERGYYWRDLRVDRLPRATIERLRALTRPDLDRALGVVAQFTIAADRQLTASPPGANLDPGVGVRHKGDVVQFGLTRREIDDVQDRLQRLVKRVDEGKIAQF